MVRYNKILKVFTGTISKLEALATKAETEEFMYTEKCKEYKAKAVAADDEKKAALNTVNKIKELLS